MVAINSEGVAGKGALESGGASRDYYTQDINAVAEDGARAYFSAGQTGQLYLREEATSGDAETIHVSESEKTNGTGPGGRDAAGTRPAAFMGASADGSSAFLTSSEKLTNDATTGTEPDTFAAIATADINDGDPLDIDFLPVSAAGIAVNATHIYWSDPSAGTISRSKLDGKDIEIVVAAAGTPQYLALDGEFIYWSNTGPLDEKSNPQDGQGAIARAKLDGSDVNLEFIKGASNPQGVAVSATHVFWANAGGKNATRSIGRAKVDGGEASQVFIDPVTQSEVPQGVAVSATHIYWSKGLGNPANGFMVRRTIDGAEASEESFFVGLNTPMRGITLSATHVHWIDVTRDTIGRAKLDLSEPNFEFVKGAGRPALGLASDATLLYWAANQEVQANPGNDLYRFDAATGKLTDLVVDKSGPNGAEVRGVLGVSEGGERVYFAANGVLSGAANPEGEVAAPGTCKGAVLTGSGTCNLYLWRDDGSADGAISFVARVEEENNQAGDAGNWAPTPSGVFASLTYQKTARVSAGGETLLFRSRRQLTDYDNEGVTHFYRYDAGAGSLDCVSCNPTGAPPGLAPRLGSMQAFLISAGRPALTLTRNLSAAGDRVFFESTERLVVEDVNGEAGCPGFVAGASTYPACRDVYMWEESGRGSCEGKVQNGGCLYLLSSGQSPQPSFFGDAGADGENAFLVTSSQLVHRDQDELYDVYDARVGGGLAAQNVVKENCEGEACKGPLPAPPATESPSGFVGPPDPAVKRKAGCPKGKRKAQVKGKARCVPKKARKRQRRAATKTRRAGR